MIPSAADRALRRLVARLAELDEADRQTILEGLSSDQAREVTRLVGDYRGADGVTLRPAVDGPWSGLGLSPVLAQRLDGETSDLRIPGARRSFSESVGAPLTPLTLTTLRRLAGELEPALPAPPPSAPASRPGLFSRFGLGGRRS